MDTSERVSAPGFAMVTAEESRQLNEAIAALADDEKPVFYIGWFWREVDFTKPFTLGVIPGGLPSTRIGSVVIEEMPECHEVGFMENNKWGYAEFGVTQVEYAEIVTRLRAIVAGGSAAGFNDYLNGLWPRTKGTATEVADEGAARVSSSPEPVRSGSASSSSETEVQP